MLEPLKFSYNWKKNEQQREKMKERVKERAHIPHAPTLLENAVYNECQFQAFSDGKSDKKVDINCSSKVSKQHFL